MCIPLFLHFYHYILTFTYASTLFPQHTIPTTHHTHVCASISTYISTNMHMQSHIKPLCSYTHHTPLYLSSHTHISYPYTSSGTHICSLSLPLSLSLTHTHTHTHTHTNTHTSIHKHSYILAPSYIHVHALIYASYHIT